MIDISIFCETGERKMEPNEQSIHTLLMRTAHKQRNYLRPYLSEIGLSTGQPKVLRCLNACGSCSQRKLADACEVDPSAICRMLDSMEREGLVQRQPSPESRREGVVRLTERGKQTFNIWEARCARIDEHMLEGFSAQERRQFCDFLARAYRNMGGQMV